MKGLGQSLAAVLVASTFSAAHGQGSFQNLDFESAMLPGIPAGQVGGLQPISNALPYWSGFIGDNPVTQVQHNNLLAGTANISILGPNWNFSSLIDGSYSVVLQPGLGPQGVLVDAALSQTSLIPVTAQSIQFKSDIFPHYFVVAVGGQSLPALLLSSGPGYRLYGAEVSPFAGQTWEVRITAQYNELDNRFAYLDSILFSGQPIPEPSVLSLFALAALLLGWRLRKRL